MAERLSNSEVLPIVSSYKNGVKKSTAEKVGFIFPIHAFTLPKIVEKFIKSLSLNQNTYVFAIATRGGSSCRAFEKMQKILSSKGINLHSYSFIEMPNNYLTVFGTPTKVNIDQLLAQAQNRIEQMSLIIKSKESYRQKDPHYSFFEKNILFPLLAQIFTKTKFFNYGNRFYANDKCNGCSICSKVCLSDRITMDNGKPKWNKNTACLMCFACIHYCPRHAVQIKKTKTPSLGRYHHPQITAEDIMVEKSGNKDNL